MSFNSSHVAVTGHAINTVTGNQVNQSQAITAEVVHINSKREIERTEYDEFEDVKRGRIVTLKRLHSEDLSKRWHYERKDGIRVRKPARSTQRTICTVQVRPDQQTKYTTVIYEGKDAHVSWKEDFERYSCSGLGKSDAWQLYGLNRSNVPFLIFHDEMVPLGHFHTHTFWGDLFVWWLRLQIDCDEADIWLNARGTLCAGPPGPSFQVPASNIIRSILVPRSAHMLQDTTSFEFFRDFSSAELERCILYYAQDQNIKVYIDDLFPESANYTSSDQGCFDWRWEYPYLKYLFKRPPRQLPLDIIRGLRFDTVYSPSLGAVARWPGGEGLWEVVGNGLVDGTEMGNGLIRFKLDGTEVGVSFLFQRVRFWESWLLQSFRATDMKAGVHQQHYIVDPHMLKLESIPRKRYLLPEHYPPIYLFVYPLPMSISELISWEKGHTRTHFWSFDENGRSRLSAEGCRRWDLPQLRPSIPYGCWLRSWPTCIYTALRQWQVSRGFDAATPNWARSLGYPELEIVDGMKDEERFGELCENTPWTSDLDDKAESLPEQHDIPSSAQESPNDESKTSLWWSWEAVAGSGISAFMC